MTERERLALEADEDARAEAGFLGEDLPEDCDEDCSSCRFVEDCEAAGGYPDVDMPNEDMDGDHASALASAGFGTDEDYGDFGGCTDF